MGLGRGRGLTGALFTASLVASDTSIEAALQRVQDFGRISKEAATSAADLLSNPIQLAREELKTRRTNTRECSS